MSDLAREFDRLDAILAAQAARLRASRDDSTGLFGGLCIGDSEADSLLLPEEWRVDQLPEQPRSSPLAELSELFQLTPFERDVLMLAAAPEFEQRYQTLYAYLQNDATRKHATAGFALRLFSRNREEHWANRRFFEENRDLMANRLIRFVDDPQDRDPSLPGRMFRVYPRIAGRLFGRKASDPEIASYARVITPRTSFRDLELPPELQQTLVRVTAALDHGGILHLRGQTTRGRQKIAESVADRLGRKLIVYDPAEAPLAEHGAILRRECRLMRAALFVDAATTALARELAHPSFPIVTTGEQKDWHALRAFQIELEIPGIAARRKIWERSLNGTAGANGLAGEIPTLAGKFCFDASQIQDAVQDAGNFALLHGASHEIRASDLNDAARMQSGATLRQFARKVIPRASWDDLVLPVRVKRQLREIVDSVRLRHKVNAEWQFDLKAGANPGIAAMFSGVSGTGKTMAASIVAHELALDLYKVDLAGIVSKYIGETEKNLDKVFNEARNASEILFFDEADAIFGKRSEVKDAHDRYANIEVAYLLQKMEEFPGLAILATNFGRNLDTAFQRRLQHVVEFPFPETADRETIWRGMFPAAAPRDENIDFPFLARQFELSGGNIRNAVLAAAYLAAAEGRPIAMDHLIQATGREYQKMGKLPSRGDFREHYDSIRERA
jgi:AAA+ superfamily predicted ATPase